MPFRETLVSVGKDTIQELVDGVKESDWSIIFYAIALVLLIQQANLGYHDLSGKFKFVGQDLVNKCPESALEGLAGCLQKLRRHPVGAMCFARGQAA